MSLFYELSSKCDHIVIVTSLIFAQFTLKVQKYIQFPPVAEKRLKS